MAKNTRLEELRWWLDVYLEVRTIDEHHNGSINELITSVKYKIQLEEKKCDERRNKKQNKH